MEKADNAKAKANLQSPFYVRDIDVRCPKDHRPLAKKDKEDTYREPQNEASKDKDKAKSHSSSTSANQPQTQAPKKDKRSRRGGHAATGVNATEVAKKDKAPKNLSHIECYTYHQKGHYATKCLHKPKKLVVVLATSTSMTNKKTEEELKRVPCIRYPVTFKDQTEALLDSRSEVNTMSQAFAQQLGLKIRKTNVGAQTIDGTTLETYGMIVSTFSVSNKDRRERVFKESFLLADVRPDIVLGMPFLTMSNADVDFQVRDLQWRSYTTGEVLPTTRQVELIWKKEFAAATLDTNYEAFVVHIAALSVDSGDKMYLSRRAQIAHLKADEASTKVPSKYADFTDVFSPKLAVELLEYIEINDHAIELVDDQQPPYGPIYSLGPVELETLKAYIKNNLANDFIRPSKSPAKAPILFDKNSDGSLRLCVDYQGLNNLIIKNWYPLPLVGESLDWLGRARRFT